MPRRVGRSLWRSASRKIMLPVANRFDIGLSLLLDRCMSNQSTLQGVGEERYRASILVKSGSDDKLLTSVSNSKGPCSSMAHTTDCSMSFFSVSKAVLASIDIGKLATVARGWIFSE